MSEPQSLPPPERGFEGQALAAGLFHQVEMQRGLRDAPITVPKQRPGRKMLLRVEADADGACLGSGRYEALSSEWSMAERRLRKRHFTIFDRKETPPFLIDKIHLLDVQGHTFR